MNKKSNDIHPEMTKLVLYEMKIRFARTNVI